MTMHGGKERVFKKIRKGAGCWEYLGWKNREGYGVIQINKKEFLVHRLVYTLLVGEIPKGLVIDHLCRNRACTNPEHMEVVTIKENVLRGVGAPAINKRKTRCTKGHEFTPNNTYAYQGGRFCQKCRYENRKKSYHKLKLQIAARRMAKKQKEV